VIQLKCGLLVMNEPLNNAPFFLDDLNAPEFDLAQVLLLGVTCYTGLYISFSDDSVTEI
jgi:hypothetical protein